MTGCRFLSSFSLAVLAGLSVLAAPGAMSQGAAQPLFCITEKSIGEPSAASNGALPYCVDQGSHWNDLTRKDFYSQDQGSQIMPLSWMMALKRPDGQPFLSDSLSRYGYLPNPQSREGLPVGFTAAGGPGAKFVGMTCSACHTRQITVEDKAYRIDGGPAIVDFQTFLEDLDTAVAAVLASPAAFAPFARDVLGVGANDPNAVQILFQGVDSWYYRYHSLMKAALPKAPGHTPWGPGRLDAVGMIFNRLTGLDLGPAPTFVIPENIRIADAPTRYPFLWNASRQNWTQWPGFARNGTDLYALSRNLGEVYGVFAAFQPVWKFGLFVDYLNSNSANFDGLDNAEGQIKALGAPKWAWPDQIDRALADKGKEIFARTDKDVNCQGCHGIQTVAGSALWQTPKIDVGTDTREYGILGWTANPGVLTSSFIPGLTDPLQPTDASIAILSNAVLGSIVEWKLTSFLPMAEATASAAPASPMSRRSIPPELREQLKGAFPVQPGAPPLAGSVEARVRAQGAAGTETTQYVYESRVLEGIWATAPYLHNGSVATLADLLKPADQRRASFRMGPAYDLKEVGLAADQKVFDYTLNTTGCEARDSGNSRCGHEYGTGLNDDEKRALLEYLKTL